MVAKETPSTVEMPEREAMVNPVLERAIKDFIFLMIAFFLLLRESLTLMEQHSSISLCLIPIWMKTAI